MLNGDIESDFDVDESSEATLKIQHDGSVNRTKLTAQALSSTAFAARLNHVQYGTWRGAAAVLLGLNFEFRFANDSIKRLTAASIRLTLEATSDASLSKDDKLNPRNDPQIVLLAPGQVRGELKEEQHQRKWTIQVPVKYNFFGLEAGVEGGLGNVITTKQDKTMWINGFSDSDDEHYEDNAIVWITQENAAQKSGIMHRFPAAVVAKLPKEPEHPVKMTVRVTPTIAFSLNPLRLKQKKDDPVFLDRSSSKGEPYAPGLDFGDPAFPWAEVVSIPGEYSDVLVV